MSVSHGDGHHRLRHARNQVHAFDVSLMLPTVRFRLQPCGQSATYESPATVDVMCQDEWFPTFRKDENGYSDLIHQTTRIQTKQNTIFFWTAERFGGLYFLYFGEKDLMPSVDLRRKFSRHHFHRYRHRERRIKNRHFLLQLEHVYYIDNVRISLTWNDNRRRFYRYLNFHR